MQLRAIGLGLLIGSAVALAQASDGAAERLRFRRYTVDRGLSARSVYAIAQDSRGFLWFATEDGLDRFDGQRFVPHTHDPADARTLGVNDVASLVVDRHGNLWAGTWGAGIARYEPATGGFTKTRARPQRRDALADDRVQWLTVDTAGNLWAGSFAGGLSRMERNGAITTWRREEGLSDNRVWCTAEDGRNFWIGTDRGLDVLHLDSGKIEHHPLAHADGTPPIVRALHRDGDGTLWAGTQQGLARIAADRKNVTWYRHDPDRATSLANDSINVIFRDSTGTLWIGTNGGGLDRFDAASDGFLHAKYDHTRGDSLADDDVRAIIEDRSHNLWIATRGGGVCQLDLKPRSFRVLDIPPPQGRAEGGTVATILEDGDVVWIGTSDGLAQLDPTSETFRVWYHDPRVPESLPPSTVQAILRDDRGNLYLGFWRGGVCRFDIASGRCTALDFDPRNTVTSFLQARDGSIWMGTSKGLHHLDRDFRPIALYRNDPARTDSLPDDFVWTIHEAGDGAIWVGNDAEGASRLDVPTGRVTRFSVQNGRLGSNRIRHFASDADGLVWIATARGLTRVDPRTGTTAHLLESDGLPSNSVFAIAGDAGGALWVTTVRGMSRITPRDRAIRNWVVRDGMRTIAFDTGALHRGASGTMYSGAVGSIVIFRPEAVRVNPHLPPVAITSLKRHDGAEVADPRGSLRLEHRQNAFTVRFAALEFTDPQVNRFRYRLEGFDPQWITTSAGEAVYSSVPPGSYVFRVAASNNDGEWNESGAVLPIVVIPPFWATTSFRILAAVALVLALSLAYKLRIGAIRRGNRMLQALVDERTKELREKAQQLARTHEIVTQINTELDFDRVLEILLSIRSNVDAAMALVFDPTADVFRVRAALGWDSAELRDVPLTLVGSSRVDLQACKLEYSIVSPK